MKLKIWRVTFLKSLLTLRNYGMDFRFREIVQTLSADTFEHLRCLVACRWSIALGVSGMIFQCSRPIKQCSLLQSDLT